MVFDDDFDWKERLHLYGKNDTPLCEEVNRMITEELTIRDEIVECASEVCGFIRQSFDDSDGWEEISDIAEMHDGGAYAVSKQEKLMVFNFGLFGKNFTVKVAMFNYADRKSKRHFRKTDGDVNTILDDKSTIVLTVKSIKGNVDWGALYSTCIHEITHGMQFMYEVPKTDQALYKAASVFFHSNDNAEKAVGKIVYYSDPHEIAAFGNSLYAELENSFDWTVSVGANFKATQTHKILDNIRWAVDFAKENRGDVEKTLKSEPINNLISYNHLIGKGENAYNALLRKCGKIIIKYQKDFWTRNRY